MLKKCALLCLALFTASSLLDAEEKAPQKDAEKTKYQIETIVATVDGKAVTKDDLYSALVQFYPQQTADTLNRLINNILVKDEAKRQGVNITKKEIEKWAKDNGIKGKLSYAMRTIIETSLLTEKLIIKKKGINITNEDVKMYFEKNREKLAQPEQVRLKQIFVKSAKDADDILVALNAGANFEKMAQAKSEDASSRDKGGDMGFFSKGMLVPEIEKAAFSMKQGGISPVIQSQAGFHIIKTVEKKKAIPAKFNTKMKKDIRGFLKNQQIQAALPEWLEALRKKAEIK
jgi:foldase protein PrsA